ncbi:MAG: phosphoribosylglycinamide synthetase [Burkholderiales bacterium]|nr:MAG: phosphoribosylglycinamide synthetase [Burkholderiales bacterium]
MRRILLLLPTTSYRNEAFAAAARRLGLEVIAAADYCHRLAPGWGLPPRMAVRFDRPEAAARTILAGLGERPDAVLAVDDAGLELAAVLSERLGLPANPPEAVRRLRDKLAFRALLSSSGLPCPRFAHLAASADPLTLLAALDLPVVVKARRLSASRGVIRADDAPGLAAAVERVRAIQRRADRDAERLGLLVEEFIPGSEHALEGLLEDGRLRILALFDKPDPLDGPYFEETILVTPSRLAPEVQRRIAETVERACRLAGLVTGPVHAEARVRGDEVWLLEIAARSIGGLCGRALTQALGMTLEELVLRHALGMDVPEPRTEDAAGVMMIPIPRRGIFRAVHNVEAALKVPGVTEVRITAQPGQVLAPPPEGNTYLGFIFSRGERPEEAEWALRLAHLQLAVELAPGHPVETAHDRAY